MSTASAIASSAMLQSKSETQTKSAANAIARNEILQGVSATPVTRGTHPASSPLRSAGNLTGSAVVNSTSPSC